MSYHFSAPPTPVAGLFTELHRFRHNDYVGDYSASSLIGTTFVTLKPTYFSTLDTNWTYNTCTGEFSPSSSGEYFFQMVFELYNTYSSGTITPQFVFKVVNTTDNTLVEYFRHHFTHSTSGTSYRSVPFQKLIPLQAGKSYKFEVQFQVQDWKINSNGTEICVFKLSKGIS